MIKYKSSQTSHKVGRSFSDRLQALLYIHAHALLSSLGRLFANKFSTSMTIVVMSIALSLAAGFYLLIVNLQQLTGELETSHQLSLFLKTNVSHHAAQRLQAKIAQDNRIEQVILIDKQQALKEFRAYSGFGDVLDILETNPLPAVIQVIPHQTLNTQDKIKPLIAKYQTLPSVDFVEIDMQWVERLNLIMQVIQRGVILLSILLSIAVLFITGNTIRLELQNRKDEVLVAKLVGATYSFIQMPFLYTGFWLGCLSGILAWLIVTIIAWLLQTPVEKLSLLYEGHFQLCYLGFYQSIELVLVASFLGIMGAWIVLHYQLRQLTSSSP